MVHNLNKDEKCGDCEVKNDRNEFLHLFDLTMFPKFFFVFVFPFIFLYVIGSIFNYYIAFVSGIFVALVALVVMPGGYDG